MPEEEAEFNLSELPDDAHLIMPGAMFTWIIGLQWKGGQSKRVSEVRFRRLPPFTKMPLLKQNKERSSELNCSQTATDKVSAPSPNELEVSVFGPGYGESILVHLGEGKWLAIDSCVDRESGQPKAISYLRSMGIDPSSAIEMVVASHWHDDHVRGLSALFREAHTAKFVCSPALTKKEFLALSDLYAKTESALQNGPKEIQACLDEVAKRKAAGQSHPIRYAQPDRTLLELSSSHHSATTRLLSLSPSDEMVSRTLIYASQTLSALEKGVREDSLIASAPNDTAIALRLDIGGRSILLGSDLEETNNPSVGWSFGTAGVSDPSSCPNFQSCASRVL
ncbi:hypothetical protein WJ972_00500 [Achromobacter insuavis]